MTKNDNEIIKLASEFLDKYESLSQGFIKAASKLDGLRQELEDAKKLYDSSTKKWWVIYQTPITICSIAFVVTVILVLYSSVSKEICTVSFGPDFSFKYERCQPISN